MEATDRLFRDYASDHQSTLYGEVSEDFLNLVKNRMGATPAVYSFLQGLHPASTDWAPSIGTPAADPEAAARGHLEVHAHLKIRPGQLERA